jgi:lipoprotein-releasing system permease protein
MPEVGCFVPYIHGAAMIRNRQETDGIIVEGIAEEDLRRTLAVERFIKKGELRFDLPDGRDGILLGEKLAKQLGAGLGDKVYLFILQPDVGFVKRPRLAAFTITGLYDSGIADYDDVFIYTSLKAAQKLFIMAIDFPAIKSGSRIIIWWRKSPIISTPPWVIPTMRAQLNDLHANLFEWLRIQRIPILLILDDRGRGGFFNIVSSLMMYRHRKKTATSAS